MSRIHFLAALALTVSSPAAAMPDSAAETRSSAVRTADLNLAWPAGIAALDRRIDYAVRKLCGTAPSLDSRAAMGVRRCRRHAIQSVAPHRYAMINAVRYVGQGGPSAPR